MKITAYKLINKTKLELIKENNISYDSNTLLNSPKNVAQFIKDYITPDYSQEEYFYIIGLNNRGNVKGISELSHGSCNASDGNILGLFQRALLMGCSNIIISHNHPSGDCKPSACDIELTKKINSGCKLLGLKLLDHIITGSDGFYSFQEGGQLND